MSRTLPLFQYPTTTVWIDDDQLFLQAINSTFAKECKLQKMFDNAREGLVFLMNYKPPLSHSLFLQGEKNHEGYDLLEHAPVDFNVTDIVKLRNCPDCADEISLLICDYTMPDMCGVKLCRELENLPMKKILLTGAATDKEVIKAFNEGVIDKFIRKDDMELPNVLKTFEKKLKRQYFCERSHALLMHLEVDYQIPLSDSVFSSFFDNWCENNQIKEFYLIDKNGSFLTIDKENKERYFIVHTDRSLDFFTKMNTDNVEMKSLVVKVTARELVPFFGIGKEAWQFESNELEKYFYAVNTFSGREKYYWCVI